ncbi:uncharacterized protein LOC119440506 [Dermacentor silvarum]|uniref:uncharacterized protein LOC119440506 n=1 Tax=Dermacentor silvarum TaxID=543639 RepID=UPI00189A75CF|nr:uncharacterized protein LOC119440506 [Dermacentor silvarum]
MGMIIALYESMKAQNESLTKENKSLKDGNELLSKRLSALEQYSRLNNLEIKGVPATQGENCLAVVHAIGDRIGCPIVESDIDAVHRVHAKKDTNIIARFGSRVKRSEFAAKAGKARLTTSAIGFAQSSNKPIFINDHLTPDNKRLFAQALEIKRGKGWKYLWTDNCVIKARKSDSSRVYRITGVMDLVIIQ